MTLYELKEKLATVGAELKSVGEQIIGSAANPAVKQEDIVALKGKKSDLQERFALLKDAHDQMEEEQRTNIGRQNPLAGAGNDAERVIKAKAEFIRAKVLNRPMANDVVEILNTVTPLQALPAVSTTGTNFLPTTLDNTLVHEPFVKNPLRGKVGMSAIKGLELPKVAFELDDDAYINDGASAQEMQLTGDKVAFGKFKFKVKVRIADTVLHGSDIDLVNFVENALRSGLAAKEKKMAFLANSSTAAATKHMSFYVEDTGETLIDTVEGATMFEAITNAIADLHEDFRENAQVAMKYTDYVTMLKELANNSVDLFSAPPEKVIGKPVFFSDAATVPIVGDFGFYHINYDPETVYDTDKDVDKGEYIWVLTAWHDQQFKLRSAFRLVDVVPVVD